MNYPAHDALLRAASIEDREIRIKEIESWVQRWAASAEVDVAVSDPHPRVIALELAAATKTMVESIALTGREQKILDIQPIDVLNYRLRMTMVRTSPSAPLSIVPVKKPPRKKGT